jgi:hypothetical protein
VFALREVLRIDRRKKIAGRYIKTQANKYASTKKGVSEKQFGDTVKENESNCTRHRHGRRKFDGRMLM